MKVTIRLLPDGKYCCFAIIDGKHTFKVGCTPEQSFEYLKEITELPLEWNGRIKIYKFKDNIGTA